MAEPENSQAERAKEFQQSLKNIGLTTPIDTPKPVAVVPSSSPPPSLTPDGQRVLEFKSFLKQLGLYNGDVSNPEAEPAFVSAAQALEDKIADALKKVSSNPVPPIRGMIWQGNHINPQTSVKDIVEALKLIQQAQQQVKSAQATVDTFDVEEYQTQQPIAVKPNPTGEDHNIETGDPDDTQQIGEMQEKLPAKIQSDPPIKAMDERILELDRLMGQLS